MSRTTAEVGTTPWGSRLRRREVIGRLAAAGVSRRSLVTVLPGWRELIDEVVDDHRPAGPGSR